MSITAEGNTVRRKTFEGWSTGNIIGANIENDEVVSVWCEVCARHADRLHIDPNIKGQARKDLDVYIMGTNFVSKHNVVWEIFPPFSVKRNIVD